MSICKWCWMAYNLNMNIKYKAQNLATKQRTAHAFFLVRFWYQSERKICTLIFTWIERSSLHYTFTCICVCLWVCMYVLAWCWIIRFPIRFFILYSKSLFYSFYCVPRSIQSMSLLNVCVRFWIKLMRDEMYYTVHSWFLNVFSSILLSVTFCTRILSTNIISKCVTCGAGVHIHKIKLMQLQKIKLKSKFFEFYTSSRIIIKYVIHIWFFP